MNEKLSLGQKTVLVLAAVPMLVFGGLGGWGTYTNIVSVFGRKETALGVVAAGEGATLVLALVLVGLTMLGQSSPLAVRAGLWLLPLTASTVCAVVADSLVESVVFAVTPMAMVVSAEGLGLLARRIVVYRTGVDMEAQRRNAETMQALSFHYAQSQRHPDEKKRAKSEKKTWKLARRVGHGDAALGMRLIGVERERMTDGADKALMQMFGLSPSVPAETVPVPSVPAETVPVPSVPAETVPVRPRAGGLSVRDCVRQLLEENPSLPKADVKGLLVERFNTETTEANLKKSWARARADLGL